MKMKQRSIKEKRIKAHENLIKMVEITFLGTSHAIPTKEKNQTSILLTHGPENILIDCGEGTQRQFKICGLNPYKITKILITHWHGDHILGLPGLVQTLALGNYNGTLEVYGPRGTRRFMEALLAMFIFKEKIKVKIQEIEEGVFFENKDFFLEAYKMDHTSPCYAYAFVQKPKYRVDIEKLKKMGVEEGPWLKDLQNGKDIKFKGKLISAKKFTSPIAGKKISFMLDTLINKKCYEAAKDADLLVSEACFLKDKKELALERKHLIAEEVGIIAKKSNVKRLLLTHISQRYSKKEKLILDEVKTKFKNAELAEDFMKVVI
jgi:ribonuclease Z